MLDNDRRSSTETTCGAETGGDRTDQHVNLGGGDVVKLGEATASSSNGSERECFVEDETVLVFVLELDLHGYSQPRRSFMQLTWIVPILANRLLSHLARKYPR